MKLSIIAGVLFTFLISFASAAQQLTPDMTHKIIPPEFSWTSYRTKCITLPDNTIMEFVWIPPGKFQMGSEVLGDAKPHAVELTNGFWLGKYEVTQEQWLAVMESNPSKFQGVRRPVESVTWPMCGEFIKKLNSLGMGVFSLPTEAQWEYACRAGTDTVYYWGNELDGNYSWSKKNSGKESHDVGTRLPNDWGLFDMSGNVSEWVNDWYASDYYNHSPMQDPTGPETAQTHRVTRGGSWFGGTVDGRSAFRCFCSMTSSYSMLGLRIAAIKLSE